MKLLSWCKTNTGKKRVRNQDFYLLDGDVGLYVLADGMGGQPGGGEASEISISAIKAEFRKIISKPGEYTREEYHEIIQNLYNVARCSLNQFASQRQDLKRLGTTIVLVLFCPTDKTLYIGNVGDSRAYLYKDKSLWQLTEDHTLINELSKLGNIDEEFGFTKKNILTKAVIASNAEIKCDIFERKLAVGEIVLLCSDGLHGMVDDKEINYVLKTTEDTSIVPDKLVDLANDHGGEDNITVLVLKAVAG